MPARTPSLSGRAEVQSWLRYEREAELLRIQPGDVGIRMSCTAFDETGGPIEYTNLLPGGLYEFQLTLRVSKFSSAKGSSLLLPGSQQHATYSAVDFYYHLILSSMRLLYRYYE